MDEVAPETSHLEVQDGMEGRMCHGTFNGLKINEGHPGVAPHIHLEVKYLELNLGYQANGKRLKDIDINVMYKYSLSKFDTQFFK
jgi:hypothetical protein